MYAPDASAALRLSEDEKSSARIWEIALLSGQMALLLSEVPAAEFSRICRRVSQAFASRAQAYYEQQRGKGKSHEPLDEAIVKKLRMLDIAGATVYRGVTGYGAPQRMRKSGWLGLSTDLPIMISTIDMEEKIKCVLPLRDEMVDEGLIAISDVEIIKYTHSRSQQEEERA